MALWDDVKKNLTEWYGTAADKTGELARVGVRRYDIFGLSRDIERQFGEIGSLVYGAVNEERDDVLQDPLLLDLVDKVRELEAELQAKEREISDIKAEGEARQSAKSEAKATTAAAASAGAVVDAEVEEVEAHAEVLEDEPVAEVFDEADAVEDFDAAEVIEPDEPEEPRG